MTEGKGQSMARPKGRPRTERDDKTVKIDRAVADKAYHVAFRRGTTLAEYLTEILRGPVEKAYRQELKSMTSDEGV
jgi:hypothetical protein